MQMMLKHYVNAVSKTQVELSITITAAIKNLQKAQIRAVGTGPADPAAAGPII